MTGRTFTMVRVLAALSALLNLILLTRNVINDRPGWALFQLCCVAAAVTSSYLLWRVALMRRDGAQGQFGE